VCQSGAPHDFECTDKENDQWTQPNTGGVANPIMVDNLFTAMTELSMAIGKVAVLP
jgi:hypothetical protein